jgi:hypothetical protein
MPQPLMPKATAVWMVENTALTFDQIADFCGLHVLEVKAIADDEVDIGMRGLDPVTTGQITQAEIDRCSQDPNLRLKISKTDIPLSSSKSKGARYTPVSKRQDRPDAIAWLVKNYPELSDGQISKLVGTTKPTIMAVREKSHWNAPNIKPKNPVSLGICSEADLQKAVMLARARSGTVRAPAPERPAVESAPATVAPAEPEQEENPADDKSRPDPNVVFGTSTKKEEPEEEEDRVPDPEVVFGPKR